MRGRSPQAASIVTKDSIQTIIRNQFFPFVTQNSIKNRLKTPNHLKTPLSALHRQVHAQRGVHLYLHSYLHKCLHTCLRMPIVHAHVCQRLHTCTGTVEAVHLQEPKPFFVRFDIGEIHSYSKDSVITPTSTSAHYLAVATSASIRL